MVIIIGKVIDNCFRLETTNVFVCIRLHDIVLQTKTYSLLQNPNMSNIPSKYDIMLQPHEYPRKELDKNAWEIDAQGISSTAATIRQTRKNSHK